MTIFLILVIVLGVSLLLIRGALNSFHPASTMDLEISGPTGARVSPEDQITFLSWNIGFAGMSAEMDFIPDGGRHFRASSAEQVALNTRSILERIHTVNAPVLFLQELSRSSFLTRGIDVLDIFQKGLTRYQSAFTPTTNTGLLPIVGRLEIGKATWSTLEMTGGVRLALPTESDFPTVTIQHFNILETRLPVEGADWEWVLFNIHLAAFDDGPLRREQLTRVVALMAEEFAAGNRVVAGGDWNLLLADTEFPYSTDEKNRFWVRELPGEVVPAGWQWGVDPSTPTCRTLEQPYRPGVNYTCIIDGFLVSPNVEILSTETVNLEFANSDHHPVVMAVRSR
jgi:endonuclease/exonuclease/phosphatase family metal-dependent hydrolase